VSSALLYQWLFLRLSPRFTLPFLGTTGGLLWYAFPPLARRLVEVLPPLLAAIAILVLFGLCPLFGLWTATAVYRLAPPRPVTWFDPPVRPPSLPGSPSAGTLGRYRRIGLVPRLSARAGRAGERPHGRGDLDRRLERLFLDGRDGLRGGRRPA
jgi:hypothetical protein